jgi:glucan phosphoethanolaminetransferase (alkaline phosphatase superfamily)
MLQETPEVRKSMPMIAPGRAALVAVLVVAGHLIACLAAITALSRLFFSSTRVVALHGLIVAGAVGLMLALVAVAIRRAWFESSNRLAGVLASIATLSATLLAALYAADAAGNLYWGGSVNYRLAWEYSTVLVPDSPPFFVSGWFHAAAVAFIIITFVLYHRLLRLLLPPLTRALHARPGARLVGWPLGSISAFCVVGYIGLTSVVAAQVRSAHLMQFEPIVAFFLTPQAVFEFNEEPAAARASAADRAARAHYPANPSFAHKNIVVIFVDALRPDHMSVYGYERRTTPFLDGLMATGRLKRAGLALSTCAESACGILSTLTSRTFPHLAIGNFSITELLSDRGYRIFRLLSGDHQTTLRPAYGSQDFYFDSTSSRHYALNDDGVLFEGLAQVPAYDGTPAFFQFHLMSAHVVGVKHRAFRRFEPAAGPGQSLLAVTDRTVLINTYDNGVLEADATIERIFDELRRKGYLADSVAVIMADHGEGLGEHGTGPSSLGHVHALYQEYIAIPLLFYDDDSEAYANLRVATQIDVAPTIVERLGLPVPSTWEGVSLLASGRHPMSVHQTKRLRPCYAVIDPAATGLFKLLTCRDDPHEELYDLATDPGEHVNLIGSASPELTRRLRDRLRQYLADVDAR